MKSSEIEALLPGVFQRTIRPGSPLDALLQVMEAMQAPSEEVLRDLDAFFNPYRTPDRFVPFLARWVDLERLLVDDPQAYRAGDLPPIPSGLGRLRTLIASAAELSRWRGTPHGLQRFLEIATGLPGFAIDEQVPGQDGLPRPFHIRVRAPAGAAAYRVLIERIVSMEKPAYVTSEIQFSE
jgi:phage tail-like protein